MIGMDLIVFGTSVGIRIKANIDNATIKSNKFPMPALIRGL
jgi:hypothetical protein